MGETSFFVKKTPVWSLILTAIITGASLTALILVVPQLSDAVQVTKDFSLAASPSDLSMNQGSTATTTLTVTSINGFDLSVGMTSTVSATIASFLLATMSSNVVTPPSFGKADSILTITSLPGTPAGTYQVTVSSSGGTKSHTITISITIGPADFTIVSTPSSLTVGQGQYNTTNLTLTSQGGFSGDVSLTATTPLAVIGVAGGPSPVHLVPGGLATSVLSIQPSSLTNAGPYTITVTGTAGGLRHSVDIQVIVKSPPSVFEALSLDSYSFISSTNVTLYIRDTGSVNVILASYYVKDASGDQYAKTVWSGPNIPPSQVVATVFLIGSSCSSCTLVGTPFTFVAGYSYTIVVVTSRNNQFTFTITR